MAADLTFGWAGVPTDEGGDGLVLSCDGFAREGDTARISGVIKDGTLADLKALVAQMLGYGPDNTDEPTVPITWAADPSVDGQWRVDKVEVSTEITGRLTDDSTLSGLAYRWSADVARVPGWQSPLLEVLRNGADRTNVHSITDGEGCTFLPGSFRVPRWDTAPDGSAFVSIENGSVRGYAGPDYENSVTYMVDPAKFYEGAAKIEVSYDSGTSWRTVTGRQVENLPGWVRLTNGRTRVTLSLASGATVLTAANWDADAATPAWESTAFHVVDQGSTSQITTYTHKNISSPFGICAVASDSRVYWGNSGVQRVGRSTMAGVIGSYLESGIGGIYGICEGPDDHVWLTDNSGNSIWEMTLTGAFTEYTDANINSPRGICEGPDGLLWFTSFANDKIGKITTAGVVTMYTPTDTDGPTDIVAGPDGLLWYTSTANDRVNKITTSGTVTSYTTGVGNAPWHICSGPDGLLWYTRFEDDAICKITTTGTVTTYTVGVPNAPNYICSDGTDLWFTYSGGIGKITTSGTVTTYTDSNVVSPQGIVKGADGNLWFTDAGTNRIGVITPSTPAVEQLEFGGTLTVLRNSPEAVSIRVGAENGDELLDLTLRRGHNYIEGYVTGTSAAYGCYRTASEAGASVTGGIEANAADANGNKYTIFSPSTITKDTTGTSGIYLTSAATSFPFAFAPTNDSTISGFATMKQAYFGATAHRQITTTR